MAKRVEETVLDLNIEAKDAFTELEKLKKSMIGLKEEQAQLTKAYKSGQITLQEYAKETVRLEAILKKETSTYNALQKSITGVEDKMDKLSQSVKDAASRINIAGVNVGDLSGKLTSFLNPATAAVGIATALGAAYARSTIGAKDLAFAQNQLSEMTTLITNDFAKLFSSAEDGEGALTKMLNSVLSFVNNSPLFVGFRVLGVDLEAYAKKAKELALISEQMEDLQRDEADLRVKANERLSDNQELLTQIQSDQTKYNDKLILADTIINNILRSEEEIRNNLEEQLRLARTKTKSDEANEALKEAEQAIEKELSALEKDSMKRVQAIERLQQNITEQNEKQLKAERDKNAEFQKTINLGNKKVDLLSAPGVKGAGQTGFKDEEDSSIVEGTLALVDSQKVAADALADISKGVQENNKKTARSYSDIGKVATLSSQEQMIALRAIADATGAVAALFDQKSGAYKTLASAQALINTYAAAAAALAPPPTGAGPLLGPILAASAIVQGLANVARINSIQIGGKAAGGGDFYTKGPTMLMVGDNPGGVERVTVEPVSGSGQTKVYPNSNLIAMAGGGSVSPAGIAATKSLTNAVNMSFRSNPMQGPVGYVSWTEGQKMARMIAFKESLTTA